MPEQPRTDRPKWTESRWDELQLVKQILRECRLLNHGSGIVERIRFLEKTAEQLEGSIRAGRTGFTRFLEEQAIAEINPTSAKAQKQTPGTVEPTT